MIEQIQSLPYHELCQLRHKKEQQRKTFAFQKNYKQADGIEIELMYINQQLGKYKKK